MATPIALLIEPKARARAQVQEALEELDWDVVPAESVDEAARVVEAHGREFSSVRVVVCNYNALLAAWWLDAITGPGTAAAQQRSSHEEPEPEPDPERRATPESQPVFVSFSLRESRRRVGVVLRRLRELVEAAGPDGLDDPAVALIVVTSDDPTPVQHESALAAGAAAYLSEADASRANILRHYFAAFGATRHEVARQFRVTPHELQQGAQEPQARIRDGKRADSGSAGSPDPSLAEAFRIDAPDLRENGYLSIRKIADYLDVPRQKLAAAIGVKPKAASARPAHPSRDALLRPFEETIALVRDAYAGDHDRVRAWLRTPRPELSGKTPLAVMLEPGHIRAVQTLVEGAWLGDPD